MIGVNLTAGQVGFLRIIERHRKRLGRFPTLAELADYLEIPASAIVGRLKVLEQKGAIELLAPASMRPEDRSYDARLRILADIS